LIILRLGTAHQEMGREGGIEEASVYYKKGVQLAKKAGNNELLTDGVRWLSECYVKTRRFDEAMDVHKSHCDEIGKENMDPNDILSFAAVLFENSQS